MFGDTKFKREFYTQHDDQLETEAAIREITENLNNGYVSKWTAAAQLRDAGACEPEIREITGVN